MGGILVSIITIFAITVVVGYISIWYYYSFIRRTTG